jgi:hypothetical protein
VSQLHAERVVQEACDVDSTFQCPFPIMAIVYLGQFFGADSKGHSDPTDVAANTMSPDEQLARMQETVHLRKPPRREGIILAILVLLIAGFWIGGYFYTRMGSTDPAETIVEGRPLSNWIEDLQSLNPDRRINAAKVLGNAGPKAKRAIPKLQDLARNGENPRIQLEAYNALRAIDPASIEGIPVPVIWKRGNK